MSNIKTIPMSTEDIQELFLNSNAEYLVDLKNSALKGEAFVTYIANMQMSCSLVVDPSTEKKDKFDILFQFMKFRQTIKCNTLIETLALVMWKIKGMPFELNDIWMTTGEMDEFISLHSEELLKISNFLDSAPLIAVSFNKELKQSIIETGIEDGSIQLIDDPDAVGVNALSLFTVPNFIEYFLAGNNPNQSVARYYKAQIERVQYSQKTLFDIFTDQNLNSFLMSIVHLLFSNGEEENALIESVSKQLT